ncbi:MAG: VWA domain-containing protein [Verrucomicrobiota bacterium]
MELRFVNPELLFLLWLILPLAVWWHYTSAGKEKKMRNFVAPRMQTRLRPANSRRRFLLQASMTCLALFLAIVAAARPQWGKSEQTTYTRSRDIVIALDVSRSMLAEDIHPNRLQRAKADIMDLVETLQGDRAALIAFRNGARLLCPLTTDYAFLRQALNGADTYSAPRGPTDLHSAANKALESFENGPASHKAIVLVSDGEDLSGNIDKAGRMAAEKNIPIYSVGLGSASGATIPDPDNPGERLSYKGKPVRSRLKHEALKTLAEKSGGAYIAIGTAGTAEVTLGNLYQDHLKRIAARSIQEKEERIYIDRFQYFLFPSAVLLLATAFMSAGRLSRNRRRNTGKPQAGAGNAHGAAGSTLAVMVIATVCFPSFARGREHADTIAKQAVANQETNAPPQTSIPIPSGREGGRIAEKLYRSGKYIDAANAYVKASDEASGNMKHVLLYNAAAAFYRAKRYQDAATLLRRLSSQHKPPERTRQMLGAALHNHALDIPPDNSTNSLQRAGLFKESADAFAAAIREEPGNDILRHDASLASQKYKQALKQATKMQVMEQYGKTPPFSLLDTMLNEERTIIENMKQAFTNDSPEQIYRLEELAARQRDAADIWIPLRRRLEHGTQASTNKLAAQQAAALQEISNSTEQYMRKTARQLKDMDTSACGSADSAERRIYGFWKQVAPYRNILYENMDRQTNSIVLNRTADSSRATASEALTQQQECADLSELFAERFDESAKTNAPDQGAEPGQAGALTDDKKKEILELAAMAGKEQNHAAQLIMQGSHTRALENQETAYRILEKIRDMLPPEKDDGQDQQKKDEKQQDQQNKQDNKPEPDNKSEQSQSDDQQQPFEEKQQQDKTEEQQQSGKKDTEEDTEEDVRQILRKALQRQKEHELEKKRRRTRTLLQPFEKDW